jgi:hypothetical protein
MAYYSFVAFAQHPVAIPDPLIMLGRGINTFTAMTEDLDGLLALLRDEDVDIKQVNQLDGLRPVPPETLLLRGESPEAFIPLLGK